VPAAIAAANAVELGSATPAQGGVVGDLDSAFDLVEADGHTVTGVAAVTAMRGLLRKARDANGQRLVDPSSDTIEGVPLAYLLLGTVPATTRAVVGDFSLAVGAADDAVALAERPALDEARHDRFEADDRGCVGGRLADR
jgi:hypothetical protein